MRAGILATVGHTPLIPLERLHTPPRLRVYAKLEGFNPCGSIKDRTALNLIESAIAAGQIRPGTTVIESSSGNLGIALAQVCRFLGLPFICVVDPKITTQNLRLLMTYGAQVERVENPDPVTGEYLPARIQRVHALREAIPNSYWPDQYSNLNNPAAQRQTMQEIVEALGDPPDAVLCTTGSCGTLRGCAGYVRDSGCKTEIIAVDAVGSVIFGLPPGKRLIPGHGAAVRPALYSADLATRCVHVTDLECVRGCRRLLHSEALLAGGSSGALVTALERIRNELPSGTRCVLVLPDRGDRYLDTIFNDDWIEKTFGAAALAQIAALTASRETPCNA